MTIHDNTIYIFRYKNGENVDGDVVTIEAHARTHGQWYAKATDSLSEGILIECITNTLFLIDAIGIEKYEAYINAKVKQPFWKDLPDIPKGTTYPVVRLNDKERDAFYDLKTFCHV